MRLSSSKWLNSARIACFTHKELRSLLARSQQDSFTHMPKVSAGLLLYRMVADELQVLLVHPGGPFWAKKDLGAWSIPKGEVDNEEGPLIAAMREFTEETGHVVQGEAVSLGSAKQRSGKTVHAWAMLGDFDCSQLKSNEFEMEWPRGSGKMRSFPEVDRAEWFSLQEAALRILPGQKIFLDRLRDLVQ